MTDNDLLNEAGQLATRAAAIIMQVRARGFDTRFKADASPVTEADHAAEAIIVEGLRATGLPVVAEEEAAAGRMVEAGSCYWLVDPLDGTREFAAGRDSFTVNIGLVRHGRAVLGAVALPALGQLYLGRVGHGAVRRDDAGEHAIAARPPPPNGLAVLASRHYAGDPALAAYLGRQRIASLGNIGSAAKFVRVAEGAADLYPPPRPHHGVGHRSAPGRRRGRRRQRHPVRRHGADLWQAWLGEPSFRLPRQGRGPGRVPSYGP